MEEQTQEANRLIELGKDQYERSQFAQALQSYKRALAIYRGLDDKNQEGNTLNYLGMVYVALGEYHHAQELYQRSLSIFQEINSLVGTGKSFQGLGLVYRSLGEYAQAQQYYEQSLVILQEIGDKKAEGTTLTGLGNLYQTLGEYSYAQQYYEQSLLIHQEIGNRRGEGYSLNNLGVISDNFRNYSQAKNYYERALFIFREIEDRAGEAIALNNLGLIHNYLEEYEAARNYYESSLEIVKEIGDKAGEGITLNNLGLIYQLFNQYEIARQFYEESLAISREIEDVIGVIDTLHNLGILYDKLQNYKTSQNFFEEAVQLIEGLRPNLSDEQKIALFEKHRRTYELLQKVLVAQNQTDQALEIAERGRARAFVELLSQKFADSQSQGAVTPVNLLEIKQIAKAQNATLVQYSLIYDEFIMECSNKWHESELYIWVIKPTGEISFRRSDLKDLWQKKDSSLAKLIGDARCFDNFICRHHITVAPTREGSVEVRTDGNLEFNREVAQRQRLPIPQQESEWQQLHQLLIDPIADLLPTDPEDRVIFVPYDSLFLMPFPALQDANGTYLIEKHTILTAPSIQVLDLTRQQKLSQTESDGNFLIVGNPTMPSVGQPPQKLSPLPGAEKEAQNIAQLLNVTPLIGSQATEAAVVEKMLSSRVIHLATHGSFDPNRGIGSWLALTPTNTDDGFLTAEEIFDLELNAELVVLSACDTGRGRITGDGVVGLSRSFISAGVPSVIVSLWKVDDEATADLMQQFYQNWLNGDDKAQALRQAMLTTMQQYPDPENWAAFTLIGEAE
ncbi:MAG: CHAT domain-containing protein [Chroococcales cyanobacterium]